MCGIFGYINFTGNNLSNEIIDAMGSSIAHRGPDDLGSFSGNGIFLGNQRLSILDLEHGNQPFYSDNNNLVLVQNGEIYNFIELRHELEQRSYKFKTSCDTEVLVKLFETHGIAGLEKLNGMFAIAIYNKQEHSLYLIRDRVGVKPLYYYHTGSALFFASEIKSLLELPFLKRELNYQALGNYLTFNYVPLPDTIFANVYHVMPGEYLKINHNNLERKSWWQLNQFSLNHTNSEQNWIEEFSATIDDAVRLRLRADVKCGAFLSGGIDSSTVTAIMHRYQHDIQTFTIGFHENNFDESQAAKEFAQKIGCKNHIKYVTSKSLQLWPKLIYYCDQPHGDISFLPTYEVNQLASNFVKVILTGDGGDELFAGYDKYLNFFRNFDYSVDYKNFYPNYLTKISLFAQTDMRNILSLKSLNHIDLEQPYLWYLDVMQQAKHLGPINQALYFDTKALLPGNNLVKPDRMGMAFSLEARTPFLDYRMIKLAFTMPGHFKIRNDCSRYLYKKAVTNLIGHKTANQEKKMFTTPIGQWFKQPAISKSVNSILVDKNSFIQEIFNTKTLCTMLQQHIAGSANFTRELRSIIAIELWGKIFMQKIAPREFN